MPRTAHTARITAHALDQRVTLQQRAAGADVLGNPTGAWVTVAEVWASASPLRGREFFAAGQLQATADTRFTIRWRPDVNEAWRVLWRSQPHDVVAPPMDVDGQRQWLELMCTAGQRSTNS